MAANPEFLAACTALEVHEFPNAEQNFDGQSELRQAQLAEQELLDPESELDRLLRDSDALVAKCKALCNIMDASQVKRTQEWISETVDELKERLQPRLDVIDALKMQMSDPELHRQFSEKIASLTKIIEKLEKDDMLTTNKDVSAKKDGASNAPVQNNK